MKLQKNRFGLKSIALFEAAKGAIVLFVGFGLLSLVHKNIQELGESVVQHLHLNPAHQIPKIFLHFLDHLESSNLAWLAIGALAYSAGRFVEAYGLWFSRAWAEWMAILSTAIYLPVEIFDILEKRSVVAAVISLINAGLLLYLLNLRRKKIQKAN